MIVIELRPGDKVEDPWSRTRHTFVAQCPHPLYAGLRLVIWRLSDGTWSHDALSAQQDVGEPIPSTDAEREDALRRALHGQEAGR